MGEKALLAVMLLAIIAVDILAGKLARRPEQVSDIGRLLELLADRVCQFAVSYTHLDVYKRQLFPQGFCW